MKVFTITKSLVLSTVLLFALCIGATAQEQPQEASGTSSQPSKTTTFFVNTVTLKSLNSGNSFNSFQTPNQTTLTGTSLLRTNWDMQHIFQNDELRKMPVYRAATTVTLPFMTDLSNVGGQTFHNYRIGKMNIQQINTFDWNGNLNNTSLEFQF